FSSSDSTSHPYLPAFPTRRSSDLKTGIITISDFRQKHLAAKGEGAPLVTYGDCLLFRDDKRDRVLLNIGGISNFTYLPRINSSSDRKSTRLNSSHVSISYAVFCLK